MYSTSEHGRNRLAPQPPHSLSLCQRLPDGSSDKDTNFFRPLPSPHHSSRQTHGDSGETATPSRRPCDYAELAPATATRSSPDANENEQEDGRCSEQQRRLEDRSRWFQSEASRKAAASSPWDSVVLKKGQALQLLSDEDIEKRWAEFESQPLREAESTLLIVTPGNHPDNEALQREVERFLFWDEFY